MGHACRGVLETGLAAHLLEPRERPGAGRAWLDERERPAPAGPTVLARRASQKSEGWGLQV